MAPGPCGAHSSLADPHSRSAAWVPSTSAVQRTSLAEHSYPSCCAGLKSPCTTFSRPPDLPEGQVQEHWSAPLRARWLIHFASSLCTRTSRQGPRPRFEGFPDCWDPGGYHHFHSTDHRRHSGSLENSPPLRGAIYGAVCQLRRGRYRVGGLSYSCMTYRRCAADSGNKFYECFLQDLRATVDEPRCRAAKGTSSA